MVMEQIVESKLPLSKLAEAVVMYPQVCRSVRVANKDAVTDNPEIQARLKQSNEKLGEDGRMLIRKSGTEPVIRVMAEAKTEDMCNKLVSDMLDLIKSLGLCEG